MPERNLFYFNGSKLDAVRGGRFKYHRERGVRALDYGDSISVRSKKGPWLFDLIGDPRESYDVSQRYPDEMQRMRVLIDAKASEMAENLRGWRGA